MSEQHVFLYDKIEPVELQIRNGKGKGLVRRMITPDTVPAGSPFVGGLIVTLPVGASIGEHVHEGDAEAYIVMSGNGTYTNKEGEKIAVKAGDVTFCYDGELHGLENTGKEPMLVVGVIGKK